MKPKLFYFIPAIVIALITWSCQDLPPTTAPGVSVTVQGTIYDLYSSDPIQGAAVYLSTREKIDSVYSASNGTYKFIVDLSKLQDYNATLTVRKSGYITEIKTISIALDTTCDIPLRIDLSTVAIVQGSVRDSSTSYPLRDATVRLTLPGTETSIITTVDGSFNLVADLVDLDTLPVIVTFVKSGYKTKQLATVLRKGQTTDLSKVYLRVDVGSTAGQVVGRVIDSKTRLAISGADVFISAGNYTDNVLTSINGDFSFTVDLQGLASLAGILRITNAGYIIKTYSITIKAGLAISAEVMLDRDTTASSALITGIVRDSVTLYPLRNATVMITVPGYVESAVTLNDGLFQLVVDLIDRDSLPILVTAYKDGYQTKRINVMAQKGKTINLGDVLLSVDVGSTTGQVVGRVFDAQSRLPLNNAMVYIVSNLLIDSMQTSPSGEYSFSIDLQGLPSLPGLLKVSKSGYKPQFQNFTVEAGKSTSIDFQLVRDTTTGIRPDTLGHAHSIAFVSLSAREISVYGVGGTESSIIIWEVRDSLGFPITIDNKDTVEFELFGTPADSIGGYQPAYVTPMKVITNVSGRVATTVNSGTRAGVLQLIAKLHRESDGRWVYSTPVLITVNAGLPDQEHFTIGVTQRNFAGYDWLGRTNGVTVQVGDKYSNPVKLNTAVYFNTTGGIITASGFTSPTGHASVTHYSGNPLPILPELAAWPSLYGDGTGYARVRAYTLGENYTHVTDSIMVLLSGQSEIHIDTTTTFFKVDSGTCITVPVRICDRFGNPLAPTTRMSLEVQFSPPEGTNWSVLASGLPDDPLGDYLTRGPGRTNFTLLICDGTPGGTPSAMPFIIKIRVSGPNDNVFTVINGVVGP
ncbi:MAG: carboxypeptidase regulatory-like domain-containing protein [Bacteroidota bacterium]|nr:carboxypeptidase regulatory-like domain-containing protein [Bacteroidota bacterium]